MPVAMMTTKASTKKHLKKGIKEILVAAKYE
jgi:hypothetical protein